MDKATQRKLKPDEMLVWGIVFSNEDLDCNQHGRLSNRQKREMWHDLIGKSLLTVIAALLAVTAFRANYYICTAGGFLIALAAINTGHECVRLLSVIRQNTSLSIEGRVELDLLAANGKSGAPYCVIIGDKTFRVNKSVFLAFKNRDPYRIFYLPRLNKILSAEWLR